MKTRKYQWAEGLLEQDKQAGGVLALNDHELKAYKERLKETESPYSLTYEQLSNLINCKSVTLVGKYYITRINVTKYGLFNQKRSMIMRHYGIDIVKTWYKDFEGKTNKEIADYLDKNIWNKKRKVKCQRET